MRKFGDPPDTLTKEQKHKIDNDLWFRAGGDCICKICGKMYKQHKEIWISDDFQLSELCGGELVKL